MPIFRFNAFHALVVIGALFVTPLFAQNPVAETNANAAAAPIDNTGRIIDTTMALLEPGQSRHAKKVKKRDDEGAPLKRTASRERQRRYPNERASTSARQVAPQWGFFGGTGFGGGGWYGSATQYGGGLWGR
jgi:hypothetical protein